MPYQVFRTMAVLAAPLGLGLLAAVHPLVDGTLIPADDLALWTFIHTLQIPLAALLGIAVLVLLDGIRGSDAAVARLAVVPWVAAFAAFDGIAGLATGALSEYGRANPGLAAGSPMVAAVLPLGAFFASLVVFGGAAVALHRAGVPAIGAGSIGFGGAVWTFVHPLVGAPAMALFAFGAVVALRTDARARRVTPAGSHALELGMVGRGR
jgi:hypothetical protein